MGASGWSEVETLNLFRREMRPVRSRVTRHLLELPHWIAMPIDKDLIPRLSANFNRDTIVRDRSTFETDNIADLAPIAIEPAYGEFHGRVLPFQTL
jgi:hypothetical protein